MSEKKISFSDLERKIAQQILDLYNQDPKKDFFKSIKTVWNKSSNVKILEGLHTESAFQKRMIQICRVIQPPSKSKRKRAKKIVQNVASTIKSKVKSTVESIEESFEESFDFREDAEKRQQRMIEDAGGPEYYEALFN